MKLRSILVSIFKSHPDANVRVRNLVYTKGDVEIDPLCNVNEVKAEFPMQEFKTINTAKKHTRGLFQSGVKVFALDKKLPISQRLSPKRAGRYDIGGAQ